jgi:oligoribonuclease
MDEPLVWVDLEMTGLDPVEHVILEIAVVVSDGRLDEVVEGPDLVVHQTDEALAGMPDVVREMHEKSGLTAAVQASTLSLADAEQQVLAFVREHVPAAGVAPLAGNSIHADRAFIRRYMPDLDGHLHYRMVDVSTVKELVARWYPDVFESRPHKAGGHRALADILE